MSTKHSGKASTMNQTTKSTVGNANPAPAPAPKAAAKPRK